MCAVSIPHRATAIKLAIKTTIGTDSGNVFQIPPIPACLTGRMYDGKYPNSEREPMMKARLDHALDNSAVVL